MPPLPKVEVPIYSILLLAHFKIFISPTIPRPSFRTPEPQSALLNLNRLPFFFEFPKFPNPVLTSKNPFLSPWFFSAYLQKSLKREISNFLERDFNDKNENFTVFQNIGSSHSDKRDGAKILDFLQVWCREERPCIFQFLKWRQISDIYTDSFIEIDKFPEFRTELQERVYLDRRIWRIKMGFNLI